MILIDNRQDKEVVDNDLNELIERILDYTLKEEEVNIETEISLIYVNNEEIRRINKETRGIDKETDVLSFPQLEYIEGNVFKNCYLNYTFMPYDLDEGKLVLGDIVLSIQKAREQSEEFEHSIKREVCYLCVHSLLHLLGYDHMEDVDKKIMREREEEILNKFDITRF
ncbi:rRNA maturation RNase YbeY [Clostridium sp. DL1XJH146]